MIRLHHLLLSTAALAACTQTPGRVGEGVLVVDVDPEARNQLDILFVIDNSGSMAGQQAALVEAARDSLFGQLTADLGHLPDLHVGVTSTSAPFPDGSPYLQGCNTTTRLPLGGQLLLGSGECTGIDTTYGAFLIDRDNHHGGRFRNYTGDLAATFGCMADLGVSGCGFEQPLAAAVRAVDGTANNGAFLRKDALLLIVIVTDEDDCSVADSIMLGEQSADLSSPLGPLSSFRCFEFGITCSEPPRELGAKSSCTVRDDGYLTPVDELAARLRAVKTDPSRIMVAGIHGGDGVITVVEDLELGGGYPAVATVCPGTSFEVTPALRLGAFGAHFPSRWILTPDCLESMAAKVARITHATTGVLERGMCLLGPAPDLAGCEVSTLSPDEVRTRIPRCADGATDCYQVVPDAALCGYTDHQLNLVVPPSMVPAGHRLQMHCGLERTSP